MENIYVFSEYPLAEWRLAESSGTPVNKGDMIVSAFLHAASSSFLGSCPDWQSGLLVRAALRILYSARGYLREKINRSDWSYSTQLSYLLY